MPTLSKGQRVTITGAAGACPGEVLHVETPATLPSISGAPEIDRVRAALDDIGVAEVAMLSYMAKDRQVCFIALGDGAGHWRDLRGQELTIAPL